MLNSAKFLKDFYRTMTTEALVNEINELHDVEYANRAEYGGHRETRDMALRNLKLATEELDRR